MLLYSMSDMTSMTQKGMAFGLIQVPLYISPPARVWGMRNVKLEFRGDCFGSSNSLAGDVVDNWVTGWN